MNLGQLKDWWPLIAGVAAFFIWLFKLSSVIGALQLKVDTMWERYLQTWEFLRDRGAGEVVEKGLAKRKSPLSIDGPQKELILQLYEPLILEIEKVVDDAMPSGINEDPDNPILFEAVGTKLGKKLMDTVCHKLNLHYGGCVALALAVVRHKRKKSK